MYSVYNKQAHRRHGGHGGRVMGGQPYTKPAKHSQDHPFDPFDPKTLNLYTKPYSVPMTPNLYGWDPQGMPLYRRPAPPNPMEAPENKANEGPQNTLFTGLASQELLRDPGPTDPRDRRARAMAMGRSRGGVPP